MAGTRTPELDYRGYVAQMEAGDRPNDYTGLAQAILSQLSEFSDVPTLSEALKSWLNSSNKIFITTGIIDIDPVIKSFEHKITQRARKDSTSQRGIDYCRQKSFEAFQSDSSRFVQYTKSYLAELGAASIETLVQPVEMDIIIASDPLATRPMKWDSRLSLTADAALTLYGPRLPVKAVDEEVAERFVIKTISVDYIPELKTAFQPGGITASQQTRINKNLARNIPTKSAIKNTTRRGIKRHSAKSWRDYRDNWDKAGYGDILSHENRIKIAKGQSPIVDDEWIAAFPEHEIYRGQKIIPHHIGGYNIVVPLPEGAHLGAHMPGGYRYNPGGPGGL